MNTQVVIWICAAVLAGASDAARADVITLAGTVVDANTAKPIPCRIHLEDVAGEYQVPEGHVAKPERTNWEVEWQKDVIKNKERVYALLDDGKFTVELAPKDGYRLEIVHGFEYEVANLTLDLADQTGTVSKKFPLKRAINMRKLGWMCADTHVHELTALGCLRQAKVEGVDYVNLMMEGPNNYIHKQGLINGKPADVSDGDTIVYISQEVRDHQYGHMTLLGIAEPIKPVRVYTGKSVFKPKAETRPNEPRNDQVWDMVHSHGGMAGHAHAGFWPGHGLAQTAALKKLDGIEVFNPDLAGRPLKRLKVNVPGYEIGYFNEIYYRMLNCGIRQPLWGGTDKMSPDRVVGGQRVYAKVDSWTHEGFMAGMASGQTFVTNGPLLFLSANGQPIGSDLKFEGKGPFTVKVVARMHTEYPVSKAELIQDGKVVHTVSVAKDQRDLTIKSDLTFTGSGWLAFRVTSPKTGVTGRWNFKRCSAHTSPIYVTVNGKLPADLPSATYLVARLDASIKWIESEAAFSSEQNRQDARKSFAQAKQFYVDALARAKAAR